MPRMNSRDDEPADPWPTRPRTDAERIEWTRSTANAGRSRIRGRRLWGVAIWTFTFGMMMALLAAPLGQPVMGHCPAVLNASGPDCAGLHIATLAQAMVLMFLGLVVGTIVFVPGRKDIIPEP